VHAVVRSTIMVEPQLSFTVSYLLGFFLLLWGCQ
jgi:hypothetical protein